MSFKHLSNYKTILILLAVVILNMAVFTLAWRLMIFVHGDLYSYGLVFSPGWADEWRDYNSLVTIFLAGATVLVALSMVPHFLCIKTPDRISKYAGFLLPVAALAFEDIAIMNLLQINDLVHNKLYAYGVQRSMDWSAIYDLSSMTATALMVVAIFALMLVAVEALRTTTIEKGYKQSFTMGLAKKTAEPQKILKPQPPKEEPKSMTAPTQVAKKEKEGNERPSAEGNEPQTTAAIASPENKARRKRGKRKTRKRKKPRKARSINREE